MADVNYALASLVDDVGARLDIGDPTPATTPTEAQIVVWLNFAQLDIANKASDYALKTLWTSQNIDVGAEMVTYGTGINGVYQTHTDVLNTDILRPVSLEYWKISGLEFSRSRLYKVRLIQQEAKLEALNSTVMGASITRPIAWLWDNILYLAVGDTTTASLLPAAGDLLQLRYIKEPQIMVDTTQENCDLPHVFQEYMVQYAVIQAKIQDGKADEAAALWTIYNTGIDKINQMALTAYMGTRDQ